MKSLTSVCLFCTALALSSAASEAPSPGTAVAVTPAPTAAPAPKLITIKFGGGTLEQLVEVINAQSEVPINIVGDHEGLSAKIPPFSVYNVRGSALVFALNTFVREQGFALTGDNNLFAVSRTNEMPFPDYRRQTLVVPVNMTPYLGNQDIDSICDAIRTGCELNGKAKSTLVLKFHPPTKLLLISGTQMEVQVAQSIINALSRGTPPPKPPAPSAPETK